MSTYKESVRHISMSFKVALDVCSGFQERGRLMGILKDAKDMIVCRNCHEGDILISHP